MGAGGGGGGRSVVSTTIRIGGTSLPACPDDPWLAISPSASSTSTAAATRDHNVNRRVAMAS
jgi:hypothetical protein